jgi:hypothetical protein
LVFVTISTICGFVQTIRYRRLGATARAFWSEGQISLVHSTGVPSISRGFGQFSLGPAQGVQFDSPEHKPIWFEAAWRDKDGTLFLWAPP